MNHGELFLHIIQLFVGNEGEVDVAQVVVYRTSSCAASHEMSAFIEQKLYIAFRVWILVVSDDYGLLVFPKVHSNDSFLLALGEVLLDGAVEEGVVLRADDNL